MWWQYALWGLAGAAVNRTLIFLEALERTKVAPWREPQGPGGLLYSIATFLHCGIAAVVVGAVSSAGGVHNAAVALGLGAAAPVVVKKLSTYTLALLPKAGDDKTRDEIDSQGQ